MKIRFVVLYSLLFGAMDTLTGLGLIFAPELTLKAMGASVDPIFLVWIRFVGAFVFSVGSLYLWGLVLDRQSSMRSGLATIWFATAWIRLVVAFVVGSLIIDRSLETTWASVPVVDFLGASFQLFWLVTGRLSFDD